MRLCLAFVALFLTSGSFTKRTPAVQLDIYKTLPTGQKQHWSYQRGGGPGFSAHEVYMPSGDVCKFTRRTNESLSSTCPAKTVYKCVSDRQYAFKYQGYEVFFTCE